MGLSVALVNSLAQGADAAPALAAAPALSVVPATARLVGREARQQLLVTRVVEGHATDATRAARYESLTPNLVRVDEHGVVRPLADGAGRVRIDLDGMQTEVAFEVRQAGEWPRETLELDVVPILTKFGCNAGACHGKSRGQNGFQLSLLGFYPEFDYEALTREGRGRRIFPAAPEESLLLKKAAGLMPHGGGRRLPPDGPEYALLLRWINAGMPRSTEADAKLVNLTVAPAQRSMAQNEQQQLLVTAHFSDGTQRDVTHAAQFQSSESVLVSIDERGLAKAGPLPGQAALMARYLDKIAIAEILLPLPGKVSHDIYAALPRKNFLDELVWQKLEQLGVTPSQPCSDTVFLRRAYTDLIGRVPRPDEVRAFVADSRPEKRDQLIDDLLQRPEYADYWANKWTDLLLPNPFHVGMKATFNYHNWIRTVFQENRPYDQFVRELLTSSGSTWRNGAVTFYRDRRTPEELTTVVSQLFLGIRLECAKCHHHPFEKWGQEDFYGLAAYFARIGRKGTGISAPISGGEEMFFASPTGPEVKHPLTGQALEPRPLFGATPVLDPQGDRRAALVDWMTSPENPYFTQVIVNRVWADLMGRGIVEPVDDLRATNPPSNGPLLSALAEDFRKQKFDLKKLLRTIATSYVYGLDSLPNERNLRDTRNYSRHYRHRLRGELLLDSVSQITGINEDFAAMPPQSRAVELWTRRVDSLFLDTFGRPDPNVDPPCERAGDTTASQALHLMNAPNLHRKVTSDQGRAAELARSSRTPREIVEELYLLIYARFPTAEESTAAQALFAAPGADRRLLVEDLMWALLNTPEFVFQN